MPPFPTLGSTVIGVKAAVALSAAFAARSGPDVKRVGVILCGGNIDLDRIPWMLPAKST